MVSLSRKRSAFVTLVVIPLALLIVFAGVCHALNKYSKEANVPKVVNDEPDNTGNDEVGEDKDAWKYLEKPFRLAKINLIWAKAKKRLTDFKIKTLYSELKVQDKEELQLKRLKADNLDKDGLKESELRQKFGSIIERYGLAEHFNQDVSGLEPNDISQRDPTNSPMFKDKKLNKLWMKAESAGFTETELKLLKEEFAHHQEKVLQFYSLLEEHNSRKIRENNAFANEVHLDDLQSLEEKEGGKSENSAIGDVRDTHRMLKDGYDRLERMTLTGPKSKDFEESRVQTLWKIALKGDFTADEIESLRTELRHYEQRLLKLRYLKAQHALQLSAPATADSVTNMSSDPEDNNVGKDLKLRIKLQERKVAKIHTDLEARITQRHFEL